MSILCGVRPEGWRNQTLLQADAGTPNSKLAHQLYNKWNSCSDIKAERLCLSIQLFLLLLARKEWGERSSFKGPEVFFAIHAVGDGKLHASRSALEEENRFVHQWIWRRPNRSRRGQMVWNNLFYDRPARLGHDRAASAVFVFVFVFLNKHSP